MPVSHVGEFFFILHCLTSHFKSNIHVDRHRLMHLKRKPVSDGCMTTIDHGNRGVTITQSAIAFKYLIAI